jgi:hypothetical protein
MVRAAPSPQRRVPIDMAGQLTTVVAMSALIYGVIEADRRGLRGRDVVVTLAVAPAEAVGFAVSQIRGRHPMTPPSLQRSRVMVIHRCLGSRSSAPSPGSCSSSASTSDRSAGSRPSRPGGCSCPRRCCPPLSALCRRG